MDKKQELEHLLRNIPDTYKDFIDGTLYDAEDNDAYDKLIDFIKATPDVTSSDVLKFVAIELDGIKPFTEEEKRAYLESLKNKQ